VVVGRTGGKERLFTSNADGRPDSLRPTLHGGEAWGVRMQQVCLYDDLPERPPRPSWVGPTRKCPRHDIGCHFTQQFSRGYFMQVGRMVKLDLSVGCINSVSGRHVALISSKIEGLSTQESRPGRISAGRRGRIFDLDCSDWSNGLRYHSFDTRPDTEFKGSSTNEGYECVSLT